MAGGNVVLPRTKGPRWRQYYRRSTLRSTLHVPVGEPTAVHRGTSCVAGGTNGSLARRWARAMVWRMNKKRAAAAILWFFAIWTAGSFAAFAFGLPDFGPILGLIAGVLVTVGYGRLAQPAPQLAGRDAQPVRASVS
jgi:hypothetical protein